LRARIEAEEQFSGFWRTGFGWHTMERRPYSHGLQVQACLGVSHALKSPETLEALESVPSGDACRIA
jgi:hypothetical protein